MAVQDKPIGIFDSGVGGLTIAMAIKKVMPNERLIYFGDTIHLPYGEKTAHTIQEYSHKIAEFLLSHDVKAIVIACNSASAAAFKSLQEQYGADLLILNVIDPVVNQAVMEGSKNVGVIGTRATIHSGVYEKGIKEKAPHKEVVVKATPLLVPIIEEGLSKSKVMKKVIKYYFESDVWQNVQALILGCTHYPLIQKDIKKFLGKAVHVFNTPKIVAQELKGKLEELGLTNASPERGNDHFYVSEFTETFERIAQEFFGEEITLEEKNIWN